MQKVVEEIAILIFVLLMRAPFSQLDKSTFKVFDIEVMKTTGFVKSKITVCCMFCIMSLEPIFRMLQDTHFVAQNLPEFHLGITFQQKVSRHNILKTLKVTWGLLISAKNTLLSSQVVIFRIPVVNYMLRFVSFYSNIIE